MKLRSVTWAVVVAIVASALFLLGCFQSTNSEKNTVQSLDDSKFLVLESSSAFIDDWSKENRIVAHIQGDPDNLHPLNGSSEFGRIVNLYLHGYLIVPDAGSKLGYGPGIVESLPAVSNNGLTYTYRLRNGVKWDNGSKLEVKDVLFSYKAAMCPLVNNPHYKPYAKAIRSIVPDSADARVFHIEMKEQNIQNAEIPTLFPILQESVWDEDLVLRNYTFEQLHSDVDLFNDDLKLRQWATAMNDWTVGRDPAKIVGLGPYQLTNWKYGQSLTLELKKNHWSNAISEVRNFDSGFPETIIFKINGDPNSTELEFKSQTYDVASTISKQTFGSLTGNELFNRNFNAVEVPSYGYSYLALNLKPDGLNHQKLFIEKSVRKAIAYAVPYDQIAQLAYGNKSTRQLGPVSPLKDDYNTGLKLIEQDLSLANQLLDDAGWIDSNGDNIRDKMIDGVLVDFRFTLNYTVSPKHLELIAELVAESLQEVGIKCEIHPVTFALLGEKKRAHNFDAFLSAWAMSAAPQDFTQIWHTESWSNGGSNYVGFGSVKSDALIDSIRTTVDYETRNRMSRRFQQMVYDEQPYVFLFAGIKRIAAHKRFENVKVYNDRPRVMLNQWKLLEHSVAAFDE